MKELNFLEEKMQVRDMIHKLKNNSNLLETEKEKCIQYGDWGIPVSLISEDTNDIFTYSHTDQYFGQNNQLDQFMKERTAHLLYSNIHHIRCNNIVQREGEFHLSTEWVEYAWYLGTNSQLKKLYKDNLTLREYLNVDATKSITPSLLGNELASVATLIIVEEGKKYLMLTLRGSNLHTYPNCMSTSVSGAMGGDEKWLDFELNEQTQNYIPSPIKTVVRESYEELGIVIAENDLEIDALSLQVEDMQLNFLISGIINVKRETISKAIQSAEDQYEIEGGPLFVPFELDVIIPLLLFLEWSPTSAASVIVTLNKYFGKEAVEQKFMEHLSR